MSWLDELHLRGEGNREAPLSLLEPRGRHLRQTPAAGRSPRSAEDYAPACIRLECEPPRPRRRSTARARRRRFHAPVMDGGRDA